MEQLLIEHSHNTQQSSLHLNEEFIESQVFIDANTVQSTLHEIKGSHIIPVFVKDNETAISHAEFIEATNDVVNSIYTHEIIKPPQIRLSHPIKGRVPEARSKPACELTEKEKTLYYERMMFIIEIPSIKDNIDGSELSLTIGGVKAYSLDNLYAKKGTDEHFKLFIGFKNKVCTNLCIWTDGYIGDLKVKSIGQLKACMYSLIESYNANFHLFGLRTLAKYSLTESQFVSLIGRTRLYQYLPSVERRGIPQLLFGDNQLAVICKDYYKNSSFCRNVDGSINLWKLFNLFTEANKSSYIDSFLDRSVNAFSFVENIKSALDGKQFNWYLS
ncbi:MAG: DUF3871 family protein [Bacteroidetes bacterium]|nr:DUF3871 family protein [Bacteroidota bacterium]